MVCVGGRYQLLGELGCGGTSTVFLAVDTVLHKQWAVKETLLQGDESYRKNIVQSLRAEVDVLKECDHPAIPRIVDFFEENGRAYAVRDYVKGRSLKSIVDEEGLQNPATVKNWGVQLCSVLAYLHSHYPPIIYGDLKPSNVIISQDGTVRLIDFGAASKLYTREGSVDFQSASMRGFEKSDLRFATPRFSAPEVLDGSEEITPASDVYALGMTLRYALFPSDASKAGLQAVTVSSENRELFENLVSVIALATTSNPSHRYKDCEEMLSALESCGLSSNRSSLNNKNSVISRRKSRESSIKRRKRSLQISTPVKTAGLSALLLFFVVVLFNCLPIFSSNAAVKPTNKTLSVEEKISRLKLIKKNKADYDSLIRMAERESSSDFAKRYISRAMKIQNSMLQKHYVRQMSFRPLRVLLRSQLADQQWSAVEERDFMSLISKYDHQLRSNSNDWASISGDIGKAYWYYFAGFSGKVANTERLSRMRVARAWFVDALAASKSALVKNQVHEAHKEASNKASMFKAYVAISDCYARLVDVSTDAPNEETYKQYVNYLLNLIKISKQNNVNILRIDTGELVLQSLHSWMRMLRGSGFSKQEVQQLCDDAKNLLDQAHASNDDVAKRQKAALDSVRQIQDEINSIFSEK
ncbi:serine/threonine protein kinase [Gardnerella sp. Marseille-QA0894]|uniref:serine/threonine protein kinase n=1 Tax=Gardnerella sp. Marseille-QA0894 TaxID=3383031 RepID=UPI003AF68D58